MSLEVDGDPTGPQLERDRTRPAWGMPAAMLVVGALVVGLGWTVLGSSDGSSVASRPAVSTPTTQHQAPATTAAPLVVSAPTTTPAPTARDLRDPVDAASAALAAWGDFAGTGDLTQVRRTFAADGPQLRQLEQEAARSEQAQSAGYSVSLSDASVAAGDTTATVTGTVTWSRPGEADQVYRWAIDLRAVDGVWRLFTVRTVDA